VLKFLVALFIVMSLGLEEEQDAIDEMSAVANTLDSQSSQFIEALRKKNILFRDKLIYTLGRGIQ
jgi:hypothetical protein